MKLYAGINGRERTLELVRDGAHCRFRLGEAPEAEADIRQPEPGVYSVLWDGRSYEARVERTAAGVMVSIAGHRFEVNVRDPRRWDRNRRAAGAHGVQSVSAPMPGKIVRLLVVEGAVVEAGQGLLVVEAMKMQNELKSPKAGRVVKLTAAEGSTVAAGQVLVTIE